MAGTSIPVFPKARRSTFPALLSDRDGIQRNEHGYIPSTWWPVLTFPVLDELRDPPLLVRDAEAVIEGHLRSSPDGVGAGILIRAGTADGGSIGAAVPAKRAETYGLEPVLPVDVWPAAYQAAHDRAARSRVGITGTRLQADG